MAKQEKKKNIRLRRRMRRTLGAVCLISALIVAAIPVPEAGAAGTDEKYTWDALIGHPDVNGKVGSENKSVIPVIPKGCDTIYTTADGTFQFAFVNASSTSPDKIAVILGYNAENLKDNTLLIPDVVEAYTKFNENVGGRTGYVAVSKNQKPLYYMAEEEVWEQREPDPSDGDAEGERVLVSPAVFKPCYSSDSVNWSTLDLSEFYYRDDTADDTYVDAAGNRYSKTESSEDQWIKSVPVMYIGNQSLTANPAAEGAVGAVQEWIIAEGTDAKDTVINTDKSKGVFANETNIKTLVVGESLMGIGNYAFYGCSYLESITLGNGLTEIGKYAFADCANMSSIGLDFGSRLKYISDYTFLNCRALTSFKLPVGVEMIYDHAFEGCTHLGDPSMGGVLDLAGSAEGKNVVLKQIGYSVFKGCTGLEELTLPESISNSTDTVNLNNFEGCNALNHIVVQSPYTAFEGTAVYTVDQFKSDVSPKFYFEANGTSAAHTFTKSNAIAFKYADRDCYEIIQRVKAVGDTGDDKTAELTYQVNSINELLYFNMTKEVEEVEIPAAIGPYGISAINSGSFSGNCFLKKITIPATVKKINENAFKGCHNLRDVIFENAAAITFIGTDAFATQVVEKHADGCTNKDFLTTDLSPKLTFTGAVGTGIIPYDYAMNPSSTINAGNQTKSYITYYSGWPTNLEIQYVADPETGKGAATLVDYPTYTELKTGLKYTASKYPYITSDYQEAAKGAIEKYEQWKINKDTEVTDYQWQIINAALNVSVPSGVKAFATGLFSGVTGKENADGSYTVEPVSGQSADAEIQTVTFADIAEYEPYSFSGCKSLKQINITGGTAALDDYAFAYAYTSDGAGSESALTTVNMSNGGSSIGDYAFCNNANLSDVTLSSTVSSLGLRPFKDCPKLEEVSFSGGPYFSCSNAIIYGMKDGAKDSIVECLESRGSLSTPGSVSSAEVAGVTSISPEAFMDCEEVGSIDLSTSQITKIPEKTFCNTGSLYSVTLPTTCQSISKDAFYDSNIRYLDIPGSVTFIDPKAFNTAEYPGSDASKPYNTIEFFCEEGSAAQIYADEYDNIKPTDKPVTTTFTVIFWDWDKSILKEEQVLIGTDATPPADPEREGHTFTGWLPNYTNVSRNMDIVAQYEKIDSEDTKYTVQFIDWDDTVLYTQRVASGEDAISPQAPVREGFTFTGWRPAITNIIEDTKVYAQYEKNTSGSGGTGSGSGSGSDGSGAGAGGSGSGGVSGNGSNTTPTLYTLTVKNGSGSGSYAEGATVIVVANEPASTQEFSKWTTDNSSISFASTTVEATTMVMPAANSTVTANYINKTNTGGGNNSGNNNNGSSNTTISGNQHTTGTVIVIDKNGLSNTGVVSATIKGSSDNFVIKISENAEATEAIIKALMDEYGSLDNLKYFPMDITLYDSTGKTKITDTSGLSISITLPLPDSLITYAGNNKVAGVVNDRLDKLTPKFTTIDGVSCVTFTAEHFSPYVIYVDMSRLSDTQVIDNSPKTGDIHPKWFVVIGLSCMAVILFVKKDKTGKNVTVRA